MTYPNNYLIDWIKEHALLPQISRNIPSLNERQNLALHNFNAQFSNFAYISSEEEVSENEDTNTSTAIDYEAFIKHAREAFRNGYTSSLEEWEQLNDKQKQAVAFTLTPLFTNREESFLFNHFAFDNLLRDEILKISLMYYLRQKQNPNIVKDLIKICQVPINWTDSIGVTPLITALIYQQSSELVQFMLDNGAQTSALIIEKASINLKNSIKNNQISSRVKLSLVRSYLCVAKFDFDLLENRSNFIQNEWPEKLQDLVALLAQLKETVCLSYLLTTLQSWNMPPSIYNQIINNYELDFGEIGVFNALSLAVRNRFQDIVKVLCDAGASVRDEVKPGINIFYYALMRPFPCTKILWTLSQTLTPEQRFEQLKRFADSYPEVYAKLKYEVFKFVLLERLNWHQQFILIHYVNNEDNFLVSDRVRKNLIRNCLRDYEVTDYVLNMPKINFYVSPRYAYKVSMPGGSLMQFIHGYLTTKPEYHYDRRVERAIANHNIDTSSLPENHPFNQECVLSRQVPNIPIKMVSGGHAYLFDFFKAIRLIDNQHRLVHPVMRDQSVPINDIIPAKDYVELLESVLERYEDSEEIISESALELDIISPPLQRIRRRNNNMLEQLGILLAGNNGSPPLAFQAGNYAVNPSPLLISITNESPPPSLRSRISSSSSMLELLEEGGLSSSRSQHNP